MTEESLKIGLRIIINRIKGALIADAEPEIEERMPAFYQRLENATEIFELQRLWDDVTDFLREVGHDVNQNLRELQIEIESKIENKGGIKPRLN